MGVLASIAAPIATVAGAGIGAGANAAATNKANSTNMAIAQMNNEFNERMMDKQMAYNDKVTDPAYIRQRLQSAGYNPSLVGTGSLGSAQSVSPAQAQGVQVQAVQPGETIAQGIRSAVELYLAKQKNDSDVRLQNVSADQIAIENQYKASQALADLAKTRAETKSTETRTAIDNILKTFQSRIYESDINQKNAMTEQVKQQTRNAVLENVMMSTQLQFLPQQLKMNLAAQAADIALKNATKNLTDKQVEHEVQKIAETIARTSLTNEQTNTQKQATQSGIISNTFNRKTFDNRVRMIKEELIRTISEQKLPVSPAQFFGFGAVRDFSGL